MRCILASTMARRRTTILVVVALLSLARSLYAERANALYLEAFGKGGVWGVGYDHRLDERFRVGIVGSAEGFSGENYVTIAPYVGLSILRHGRSSWFADFGGQVAYVWSESPVPEWDGDSSAGIGGIVSTGYEFRGRLLFRLYVHGVIGKGGLLPWAGTGVGWAF
jgi:hypothetical protein